MISLVREDGLLKDYFNNARIIIEDNIYNRDHRSIFAEIAAHNQGALMEALMVGVDVNMTRETDNATPLHVACEVGTLESVELLLNRGANPNAQNDSGMTPLFLCVLGDDSLKKAQLLIEYGADVNATMFRGRTILHLLASRCYKDDIPFIRFLCENGADPLLKDDEGQDAFEVANLYDKEMALVFKGR